MWFFAILVVLALGGVALLAAGRGAPMVEVYDDRPDSSVPATGPLAADDLRRVRFSLAFRGYRMSEVDALLDRLASERESEAAEPVTEPVTEPATESPRGDDHTQ
jgi:DivIVA domain-containing protein